MNKDIKINLKKFAGNIQGHFEENKEGYFLADRDKIIISKKPATITFEEIRSIGASDHNKYNVFTVFAPLNQPCSVNFKLKVINNLITRLFTKTFKDRIKIKGKNKELGHNLLNKQYFINYFYKYNFVKLQVDSSKIELKATNLNSINLDFLNDSYHLFTNVLKEL